MGWFIIFGRCVCSCRVYSVFSVFIWYDLYMYMYMYMHMHMYVYMYVYMHMHM